MLPHCESNTGGPRDIGSHNVAHTCTHGGIELRHWWMRTQQLNLEDMHHTRGVGALSHTTDLGSQAGIELRHWWI